MDVPDIYDVFSFFLEIKMLLRTEPCLVLRLYQILAKQICKLPVNY